MEEEGKVTVAYNRIVFRGKTIADLVSEMYEEGEEDGDEETSSRFYYRDVVDVAIQTHDALRRQSQCPCKGPVEGKRSKNAIFVVSPRLLQGRKRGNHVVVPATGLFDSDEAGPIFSAIRGKLNMDKHSHKRKRAKTLDVDERNICLVALYEDGQGNVVFRHHSDVFNVASMTETRLIVYPYTQSVAREVWSDAKARYRDEENDAEEDRVYWSEQDKYAKNEVDEAMWIGVNAYELWPQLHQWIPQEDGSLTSYTSSSLLTPARGGAGPLVGGGGGTRRARKDLSDTHSAASLYILRDTVILNALRLHELVKSRGKRLPSEAVQLHTNTDHKEDTDLEYSIVFFDTAAEAQRYARAHGFYMGAHDIHSESGAKRFFVPTTCFSAYENIRLRECQAPPPGMYERGHDKKMLFSHECMLPERRTKLYIDLDVSVKEAAHYLPYEKDIHMSHFTWDIVDRITLAVMCWFGDFFHRVFGVRPRVEDWAVMCATDLYRKMSRHLVLAKPECFFRSKLDLMMFMDMAQYQLSRDMATRKRHLDYKMYTVDVQAQKRIPNASPLSWMAKMVRQMDAVTKTEIKCERSIIDFAVYGEFSFMRGLYCSKMSEPHRILNHVRVDGSHLADPDHPMRSIGETGVFFDVENALHTMPRSDAQIEADFALWKRASIQCVEPEAGEGPCGEHRPSGEGLTLPLGTIFPRVTNVKIKRETIDQYQDAMTSVGEDSSDGFRIKNVLLSFTNRCWWKTSTVPDGAPRQYVETLLASMLRPTTTVSGVSGGFGGGFRGSLTSLAYSNESIRVGESDGECPYRMLRGYFGQINPPQVERIIDVKPWAECEDMVLTRKIDMRSEEEREEMARLKREAYEATLPENKRRRYTSKYKSSRFYSRSLGSKGTLGTKKKAKSREDHVQVNFKGTKWCPIAMKDHRSAGKVYLKIYRNGDVVCRCFSDNCKDIASNHNTTSTYRKLYPLSEAQRLILWPDERESK
jgi:hypothetical protein